MAHRRLDLAGSHLRRWLTFITYKQNVCSKPIAGGAVQPSLNPLAGHSRLLLSFYPLITFFRFILLFILINYSPLSGVWPQRGCLGRPNAFTSLISTPSRPFSSANIRTFSRKFANHPQAAFQGLRTGHVLPGALPSAGDLS